MDRVPGARARGRAAIFSVSSTAAVRTTGFSAVLHFPAIAVSGELWIIYWWCFHWDLHYIGLEFW